MKEFRLGGVVLVWQGVWLVPVRWEDGGTESEECSSKSY